MSKETKKIFVIIVAAFLWILFQNVDSTIAKDPEYPTKPITFYIGITPGSGTDLSSRALITAANKHLSQPMVPIQKVGGVGSIAAMAIKTSAPDGYTIGQMSMSTAFVVPFSEGAPFKDLTGFKFISNFGTYDFPLVVRGDSPWKTFNEFIEWARKNPRGVKVGMTGTRTTDYKGLVLWEIEQRENVEFIYVPFKGSKENVAALLGGHINAMITLVDDLSYFRDGTLRILLYSNVNKFPGYEHIPSSLELYGVGVPDLLCVYGPKGLPEYVVKTLDDAFAKAVKDPDFIKLMNRLGMPIIYMDSVKLKKYVDEIFEKTAKIYERLRVEVEKEKKK